MQGQKNRTVTKMPKGKLCGYVCRDCALLDMNDKGARDSHMCLHYRQYTLDEDSIAAVCKYFIAR